MSEMRAVLILAALIASVSQAPAATLDRVRATGTFTIAYRADAKPYSYRDARGQPAGYIVELCREVAAAVRQEVGGNINVSFVVAPADRRFETVRDGKADILCDPSTVTLSRRKIVDFSLPTFMDGAGVLSRDAKPVDKIEDLKGRRVGVLTGTTTEQVLRTGLAELQVNAEVTAVHDHRQGINLLTSDQIDAYFGDRAILNAFVLQDPLPGFHVAKRYFSLETYALALPRDDSAFRLLVDTTLARLYRTGKIRALLAKTFGRLPPDELLDTLILMNSLPD
jgi:ABC-type amino acid transport substrate-binding protein